MGAPTLNPPSTRASLPRPAAARSMPFLRMVVPCLVLGFPVIGKADTITLPAGSVEQPAVVQEETALNLRLRPVPQTLPEGLQADLGKTLNGLLRDRKKLNTRLDQHFATYGAEVDTAAANYPQYVTSKAEIVSQNDELLSRMKAYNASTSSALQQYIDRLKVEIDQTKENLKSQQRAFANEAQAFEDLADTSERQRDALMDSLRDRAKEAALEGGEAGVEAGLERAAKITPARATKIIAQLEKAGANNPDLLDLVRAIGDAKSKKARVEAGLKFYKMLKNEKTIWDLNALVGREEYLAALIEVISWVSPSPWLKVCAEGLVDSGKADLEAWVVLGREEQTLSSATETQLRELTIVGGRLMALVKARNKSVQELKVLPTLSVEPMTIKG
jgi:flagellar biosynthesis chaperone FliJ